MSEKSMSGRRPERKIPNNQLEQLRRVYVDLLGSVSRDRLALSTQCGFASTEEGNLVSPADQAAKLRLVVETAREVWG
jgi:5-methyltetrahydropteroyltriglutamate--homocysteine methyltransferase